MASGTHLGGRRDHAEQLQLPDPVLYTRGAGRNAPRAAPGSSGGYRS